MKVLLTGAGRGIGFALAKEFIKNKRCELYVISRSRKNLRILSEECASINRGAKVVPVVFDLDRLVEEDLPPEMNCDRLDIIVNNAGLLVRKDFVSTTVSEMTKMFTTNLFVPALLIQKTLKLLGGDQPSHIINIGSMGGFQGSRKFPGLSLYSASKAALASLTECLAAEYSERNIFFNCLALGAVQTEMLNTAFPGYKAPLTADQMAAFIADFSLNGYKYFNGKVLPVSGSTP